MKYFIVTSLLFLCVGFHSQIPVVSPEEDVWIGPIDTIRSHVPMKKLITPLIEYRKGNKWGYCDTNKKIIIKPKYDDVSLIFEDYYLHTSRHHCYKYGIHYLDKRNLFNYYQVEVNGKYGVVTPSKSILEPKYNKIRSMSSVFLIETETRKLFSLNGKPLLDSARIVHEMNINSLASKNIFIYAVEGKKSGVFAYDVKKQKIIKWLFETKESMWIRQCTTKPRFDIWKGNDVKIYEISKGEKLSKISINTIAEDVLKKEYEEYKNSPNKVSSFDYEYDRSKFKKAKTYSLTYKLIEKDDQIYLTRRGGGHFHYYNPLKDTTLIKIKNYSIKKFSAGWYSSKPRENEDIAKLDSIFYYANYIEYQNKNGEKGLIVGKNKTEPIFRDITPINIQSKKPHFLVSILKNGKRKWGIINSKGEFTLPAIYDSIIKPSNDNYIYSDYSSWVIVKDGLHGLIHIDGRIISEPIYQKIEGSYGFNSFTIKNKGKFGYYKYPHFVEPTFNYRVRDYSAIKEIGGKTYFKLINSNGKIMGWADSMGKEYFDN